MDSWHRLQFFIKYVNKMLKRSIFYLLSCTYEHPICQFNVSNYDQFIIHVLEIHLKSSLLNMPIHSEHQFRNIISSIHVNFLWDCEDIDAIWHIGQTGWYIKKKKAMYYVVLILDWDKFPRWKVVSLPVNKSSNSV